LNPLNVEIIILNKVRIGTATENILNGIISAGSWNICIAIVSDDKNKNNPTKMPTVELTRSEIEMNVGIFLYSFFPRLYAIFRVSPCINPKEQITTQMLRIANARESTPYSAFVQYLITKTLPTKPKNTLIKDPIKTMPVPFAIV